jgi:hypothetical protein
MNDETDLQAESRRSRLTISARPKTPRAARTGRNKKKVATGFGGSHQRRNKHWSW